MNLRKKIALSSVAAALVIVVAPREASASYICATSYMSDKDYGTYGHLYVSLYDQPYCQGNYEGYKLWCSTNATYVFCASDVDDLAPTYSVLLEAWKIALEVMRNGEQVYAVSAGSNAFKGLTIYSY